MSCLALPTSDGEARSSEGELGDGSSDSSDEVTVELADGVGESDVWADGVGV